MEYPRWVIRSIHDSDNMLIINILNQVQKARQAFFFKHQSFSFEHIRYIQVLQFLIGVINAKLLNWVYIKKLKPKDIKHANLSIIASRLRLKTHIQLSNNPIKSIVEYILHKRISNSLANIRSSRSISFLLPWHFHCKLSATKLNLLSIKFQQLTRI